MQHEGTGEVIYTPPSPEKVPQLMADLERYIHAESELDPLIRMALIHHQFESIHPFYDGNGRMGRTVNILFLVREGLLVMPILYLSRYINQTKADYYRFLQVVRDLNVSRATASRYLDALAADGTLRKQRMGRENYYINHELVDLLFNLPEMKG